MFDLGFVPKISFCNKSVTTSKEMLNVKVIHRCLERCLVKGKIIRNFSALPADNMSAWIGSLQSAHPLDESL